MSSLTISSLSWNVETVNVQDVSSVESPPDEQAPSVTSIDAPSKDLSSFFMFFFPSRIKQEQFYETADEGSVHPRFHRCGFHCH